MMTVTNAVVIGSHISSQRHQQRTMMKSLTATTVCLLLSGATAWTPSTSPKAPFQKLVRNGKAMAVTAAAVSLLVQPSNALDSAIYNHGYADPLHPQCQRTVVVNPKEESFHYSGTSVKSPKGDKVLHGCSPEEIEQFGIRRGSFDGVILANGGISAGDGIHEGVWEPANSASTTLGFEDVDGIRWNDGNKWTVKDKSVATKTGEFITLSYIGVSLLAGVRGVAQKLEERKNKS